MHAWVSIQPQDQLLVLLFIHFWFFQFSLFYFFSPTASHLPPLCMFAWLGCNERYRHARVLCSAWQFVNEKWKQLVIWFSWPSALNIKKKTQGSLYFITENQLIIQLKSLPRPKSSHVQKWALAKQQTCVLLMLFKDLQGDLLQVLQQWQLHSAQR